jgi:hypothetical protein
MAPTKASERPKKGTKTTRRASNPRASTGAVKKPQLAKKSKTSRKINGGQPRTKPKQAKRRNTEASQIPDAGSDLEESDEDDFPAPPNAGEFSYLKVRTVYYPQDTVMTQWKAMPEPAQKRVKGLVTDARFGVENNAQTLKGRTERSAAIDPLMKRIMSRLMRIPAPPKTREENFDLEKLLEKSVSFSIIVRAHDN